MKKILHILVNYKNTDDTIHFLRSAHGQRGADQVQFVVVNNSAEVASDSTFSDWISRGVQVLNRPDNPGYFGAAQAAWKTFRGNAFDFVILSNTDLELRSSDFYFHLLTTKIPIDVGLIGPSIHSELLRREGNPMSFEPPTLGKLRFLAWLYKHHALAWMYHFLMYVVSLLKSLRSERPRNFSQHVYALHGAVLIFTSKYFSLGGDFHHPVKLYGEELHVAERLRQMGLRTIVDYSLKVNHREAGTLPNFWQRVGLPTQKLQAKKEAADFLLRLYS